MNRITKNVLAWNFFDDGQDADEILNSYILSDRDNKRLNTLDPSDRYAALVNIIRDALADRLEQVHEDFVMNARHSPYTERLLRIAMRDIDFVELIDAHGWNHAVTETANLIWFGNPEGGQQAQSIRFKTTGKDIHTDLDKAVGATHD